MGIYKGHGPTTYARIYTYSTPFFPILETNMSTIFTIPLDPANIWIEESFAEQEKISEELYAGNKKQLHNIVG